MMNDEYNITNSTNSIIDRDLSPSVVGQLVNSTETVRIVLQQICDFIPTEHNEKGEVIKIGLGTNSLVNEKGLKNMSAILYSLSNKDVGIGFRNEKRINNLMTFTINSFIRDLAKNFIEWGIKFNDISTIVTITKYFLVGVLSKSYKGHSMKLIAGGIETKENRTIQEKKKAGLGGLFGFSNKEVEEE